MTFNTIVVFLQSHVVQVVSIFFVIILNGFRQTLAQYFASKKKYSLVHEFLSKFRTFTNEYKQKKFNTELYGWLNYHSGEVQREIGVYGLADYRPPFENFIIHNHAIIVNVLSEMRSRWDTHPSMISFVDDNLMRYLGDANSVLKGERAMTCNPLMWLRYGMQSIIVFPFTILYWFGALNKESVEKIRENPLIKLTSIATAVVGLMSTVISAIGEKDQFWQALKTILNGGKLP